jgi:hypothetical protein
MSHKAIQLSPSTARLVGSLFSNLLNVANAKDNYPMQGLCPRSKGRARSLLLPTELASSFAHLPLRRSHERRRDSRSNKVSGKLRGTTRTWIEVQNHEWQNYPREGRVPRPHVCGLSGRLLAQCSRGASLPTHRLTLPLGFGPHHSLGPGSTCRAF